MNARDEFPRICDGLAADRAELLPRLAQVLRVWDVAALELGETAIVTSGSADAALYCVAASWRSGRSPLYVNVDQGPVPSGDTAIVIEAAGPQRAIEALTARLESAPGAAAVILSPSAQAVGVLFESLPTWGRVVLAAQSMEPTAIDFYNHVHRRGVRLLGMPPAAAGMSDAEQRQQTGLHLRRARSILDHDQLAECCLRAVIRK